MSPVQSSAAAAVNICPASLVDYGRRQIQVGSKSFSFASFFFSERERQGAWLLYSWCRYCDDEIDRAASPTEALARLSALEELTHAACHGDMALEHPVFQGLRWVTREFQIPEKYPLDLLRGMRMDVEGRSYENLAELEDYCYCVAGVVGLMMCHVMGLSRTEALSNAVALGSAMQLTNICRDVDQDLALGRVYFPRQWLREAGIADGPDLLHNFAAPEARKKWASLAARLLRVADERYQHGILGLDSLSFRAALAVGIAGRVYRQIGVKVLAHGDQAWDHRCYTRLDEKLWVAAQAVVDIGWRLFHRMWNRWQPQPISAVWKGDQ